MKENLKISGNKPEVALYDFVLKEQMQVISKNVEAKFRRQHKMQIKGRVANIRMIRREGRPL